MASEAADDAFEGVRYSFGDEESVSETEDGLVVHGRLFAFLEGDDLVVEVGPARANDLVARGIAERFTSEGQESRKWIRVADQQLWPELAREAHEYVGEPPVGGES